MKKKQHHLVFSNLKQYINILWRSAYKIQKQKNKIIFKFLGITIKSIKKKPIIEYYKKKFVLENKKNIEIAVLGSSHGNRGFNSSFMAKPAINLATTSQDLYQSYNLCKLAIEKRPEIKTIFLFYAPFSSGFNISHSSEKFRAAYMDKIFSIPPYQKDNKIKPYYKEKYKTFIKYDTIDMFSDNNLLLEDDQEEKDEIIIQKRAQKHMSLVKNSYMNKFLILLIDLLKKEKINLYIIIPPYTSLYKKYIDQNLAFSEMQAICEKESVKILSFYNDVDFQDEDFNDGDHLNVLGANKLTQKINNILENNSENN